MKRFVLLVATIIMVLGMSSICYATEELSQDSSNNQTEESIESEDALLIVPLGTVSKTVSEYDMIKELQGYTTSQLESKGYTATEINSIQQPLATKETYGKVTYTITYDQMYQKNGETFLRTKMTWNWSKVPTFLFNDIMAMTTSEAFTKDSATAKVQYYWGGNKSKKSNLVTETVKTKSSGAGVYASFPMGKDWDRDNRTYKEIAMSGYMQTSWSISGKYTQVGISSNYGHSVITGTPSVSFSKAASISFTPEERCKSGDEAYDKAKLK